MDSCRGPETEAAPPRGSHHRQLVEHVLAALRPSLADPAAVSRITREVEQLDPRSLEAAATAADLALNIADDDGWGAATFGSDFMEGAREDAMADLLRVVEAGRRCTEERRKYGVRGVATRIAEDGLWGWRISRRPTTRPGQLLARPRARRSSPGRRRGSRRGTGSRAGPGDDSGESDSGDHDSHSRRSATGRLTSRLTGALARPPRGGAA